MEGKEGNAKKKGERKTGEEMERKERGREGREESFVRPIF